MVVDNHIDLGLVEGPIHHRGLAVKRYDTDRLVVVLPPGHRLAGCKKIPFESLEGVPLILREEGSGTREVFLEHAKKAGVDLDDLTIAMELGSPEAIKSAVGAGLGVSVISMAALRNEIKLQSLLAIPLDPPIERPFSFIHSKQKFRVPAVEELLFFATERGDD
eukprot:XP_019858445.1 PREDICTED: uncharacterized protein LOC109586675 [Amphimedon queenslandica]